MTGRNEDLEVHTIVLKRDKFTDEIFGAIRELAPEPIISVPIDIESMYLDRLTTAFPSVDIHNGGPSDLYKD